MSKLPRSRIMLPLALATISAGAIWIGLFAIRVREQQVAISALEDIEIVELMCVLPGADGTAVASPFSRRKLISPVRYETWGPNWLRARLGEQRCRRWLDTAVGVDLAGSEATDSDIEQLLCLSRLRKVDISGTKVTDAGLDLLGHLTLLEELHVSTRGEGCLAQLRRLSNIRILVLDSPSLTDATLHQLAGFPKLTDLSLYGSGITDDGMNVLSDLATLETLNLAGAKLTDAGVQMLAHLPRLKRLYLGFIPDISDACLEQLQRKRPGLSVVYEPYGAAP